MRLITLLLSVFIISLLVYLWASNITRLSDDSSKTNYQEVEQQLDVMQEKVNKYNTTLENYQITE